MGNETTQFESYVQSKIDTVHLTLFCKLDYHTLSHILPYTLLLGPTNEIGLFEMAKGMLIKSENPKYAHYY